MCDDCYILDRCQDNALASGVTAAAVGHDAGNNACIGCDNLRYISRLLNQNVFLPVLKYSRTILIEYSSF